MRNRNWLVVLGGALALVVTIVWAAPNSAQSAASTGEFASETIDLGVVVSDLEKSADFYTKTIGFTEVEGFKVAADFCRDAGLTVDGGLDIRVFVLGEAPTATRLKLMESPVGSATSNDDKTIVSRLGFSYLTIRVKDLDRALERLAETKVSSLAKGPVPLPKGFPNLYLSLVRDPDGNFVELIGPMKN
ncbi:Glyoxalase-like domain protein [Planctomycetes bacterium Pan216]|uniref:Glyoxalase-like domain protein n=1 Tax=Kolteria novifilia TaxID=2527975 RepID=A0A518B4X0_9BACT|nr:Glyoxalase-like domain protein [Planctomycetes bacterium Pan216]